jgi:hypothetical protein
MRASFDFIGKLSFDPSIPEDDGGYNTKNAIRYIKEFPHSVALDSGDTVSLKLHILDTGNDFVNISGTAKFEEDALEDVESIDDVEEIAKEVLGEWSGWIGLDTDLLSAKFKFVSAKKIKANARLNGKLIVKESEYKITQFYEMDRNVLEGMGQIVLDSGDVYRWCIPTSASDNTHRHIWIYDYTINGVYTSVKHWAHPFKLKGLPIEAIADLEEYLKSANWGKGRWHRLTKR